LSNGTLGCIFLNYYELYSGYLTLANQAFTTPPPTRSMTSPTEFPEADSQATTTVATESQAWLSGVPHPNGCVQPGGRKVHKIQHTWGAQVSDVLWPTNLDFSPHDDPLMKLTESLVIIKWVVVILYVNHNLYCGF
jgi:hypothetical protein